MDERETFLQERVTNRGRAVHLTPEAIEDLRYFQKRADEGKPMPFESLAEWLESKRGITAGRRGLYTACVVNGITPWWK